MYRIFTTREFDGDFFKLDGFERRKVNKIINQLKEKGDNVGKLLGRKYFREKKFGKRRLYFLVYKDFMIILAVGISNKKTQQETINKIISDIKSYEKFIINELRKKD